MPLIYLGREETRRETSWRIDYLGDVPWTEDDAAKAWYVRVKSRPTFRPLLSEWLAGVPASPTYMDLDF